MRVRDDDEGQISERLDAMCKAGWEDREREVGRREELLGRERWSSVSVTRPWSAIESRKKSNVAYLTRSARVNGCKGKLASLEISASVTVLVCNVWL